MRCSATIAIQLQPPMIAMRWKNPVGALCQVPIASMTETVVLATKKAMIERTGNTREEKLLHGWKVGFDRARRSIIFWSRADRTLGVRAFNKGRIMRYLSVLPS